MPKPPILMTNSLQVSPQEPAPGSGKTAPPRALILDFGGVISRTLFETHPQTEQALGITTVAFEVHAPGASFARVLGLLGVPRHC
jgi:hypothetical protein